MGRITQTELVPTLEDNIGMSTTMKMNKDALTLCQGAEELVFQWGDEIEDLQLMERWFEEAAEALGRIRVRKQERR